MIYFATRSKARAFAKGNKPVIDLLVKGLTSPGKHRWAVKAV